MKHGIGIAILGLALLSACDKEEYDGTCAGEVTRCDVIYSPQVCAEQEGCWWGECYRSSPCCKGEVARCAELTDRTSCANQRVCTWTPEK
jgi:hypothetical protein